MSVSLTVDDQYCVHHNRGNRSSFQAAFLMMANEMKLICERKKMEAEKEKDGNEEESSGTEDIDYVQDRNKETTSNKSGSSLLPKNVDCGGQNWVRTRFVCFNQVNFRVLLISHFAYVFAHLLDFYLCFSDFGHFILGGGNAHFGGQHAIAHLSRRSTAGWLRKNMMLVGTDWACCLFLTFYLQCRLKACRLVCLINGLLKWTSIRFNCIYLIDFRVKKKVLQVNKLFC